MDCEDAAEALASGGVQKENSGVHGTPAWIVRTPQEALASGGVPKIDSGVLWTPAVPLWTPQKFRQVVASGN